MKNYRLGEQTEFKFAKEIERERNRNEIKEGFERVGIIAGVTIGLFSLGYVLGLYKFSDLFIDYIQNLVS